MMNMYAPYSLLDLGLNDPAIIDSLALHNSSPFTADGYAGLRAPTENSSRHRHDGTSPLPLGIDWSPPPRVWDGQSTVWPHDFRRGWSYCVTVPSWSVSSESSGSESVVLYKVLVGIQSPQGITTTRGILRRFSDFVALSSDLRKEFPKKKMPPAPRRGLLKIKSIDLLEERRHSLEDWMMKVLSDIDLSRSLPVAIFIELEAAVRSTFNELNKNIPDKDPSVSGIVPSVQFTNLSAVSPMVSTSSFTSDVVNDSAHEIPEPRTPKHGRGSCSGTESAACDLLPKDNGTISSPELPDVSGALKRLDEPPGSDLQSLSDSKTVLMSDEQNKMTRTLSTTQQGLDSLKDMEDLIARLNQELALRHCLTTKVKDLETEVESAEQSSIGNIQQAVLTERERIIKMLRDMDELRRKYLEIDAGLKSEQDEKHQAVSTNCSILRENETLRQELDAAQQQLKNLQNHQVESDMESKTDLKQLVKEVESLRSSHSEMTQELSILTKLKKEVEAILHEERQSREHTDAANAKLLDECKILRTRLEECSVDFHIDNENKLIMDTPSSSDAIDILVTADNQIGSLLAEAELLVQGVENADDDDSGIRDSDLRKMLIDVLSDNARLRKRVNSVIRCALCPPCRSEKDDEEGTPENTVLCSEE